MLDAILASTLLPPSVLEGPYRTATGKQGTQRRRSPVIRLIRTQVVAAR